MVGVLHGAELAFKKDRLSLFDGPLQVLGNIAHIGSDHVAVLQQCIQKRLLVDRIFVIEIHQKDVFFDTDIRDLLRKDRLVLKQLIDLESDLCILVGIERRDARLGGTEGFSCQSLLLKLVEENVIRHHDLAAVRDHQLRRRNSLLGDLLNLFKEKRDIQRDSVSDNVHHVLMKNA